MAQQQQQQSPPQSSMSSLEALIQAAQYLEDSESEANIWGCVGCVCCLGVCGMLPVGVWVCALHNSF